MSYSQNTQNAVKIDEHIKNNPDSTIPKVVTIKLHGKRTDLHTYRIPLSLTFYNIKNGRFAAEYADLKRDENREFNTTNFVDSKRIKDLLLELDPNQSQLLEKDMLQNGQKEPGIITHDGYVINGNRRRAVLDNLVSAYGRSEFSFIEVARLPPNVSTQDLWKIEAGIQLSHNPQLNYGPINELLKFKEGIDSGLSPKEIANELYGGFKEKDILTKLEEFKLIAEYLRFIQEPDVFNKAKGIHEHFTYLRKILNEFEDKINPKIEEKIRAKHIGFQLIHDGVQAREFRKMKDILLDNSAIDELWSAEKYSEPEPLSVKEEKKLLADQRDEFTEARTIFNNCLDSVKAHSEAQQPEKLLERALKNLKSIDTKHCDLNSPPVKQLIEDTRKVLDHLCSVKHDMDYQD